MRKLTISLTALAVAGLAVPTLAQQIPPMTNPAAAIACKPKDVAAAVVCLDQHLKPDVKAGMLKSNVGNQLEADEIYVGLWIRNNWGLWTGSDLAQSIHAAGLPQIEHMSERVVDAYWLKIHGCDYDWNNVILLGAAITQGRAGGDPCKATMPAGGAGRGGARGGRGGAAGGRGGRGAAPAAGAAAPNLKQ